LPAPAKPAAALRDLCNLLIYHGFLTRYGGAPTTPRASRIMPRRPRITPRRPRIMRRAIRPAFIRPASMRRENF